MKIVKSFEDPEFFDLVIEGPNDPAKDIWTWGLSDDGEIYYQCSDESIPLPWHPLKHNGMAASRVSLRIMKRLVKEFGHLLVFL